jgi:hypothetical protein
MEARVIAWAKRRICAISAATSSGASASACTVPPSQSPRFVDVSQRVGERLFQPMAKVSVTTRLPRPFLSRVRPDLATLIRPGDDRDILPLRGATLEGPSHELVALGSENPFS